MFMGKTTQLGVTSLDLDDSDQFHGGDVCLARREVMSSMSLASSIVSGTSESQDHQALLSWSFDKHSWLGCGSWVTGNRCVLSMTCIRG